MAYFNRMDICEAYLALDMDWNLGGMLPQRRKSVSYQLHAVRFRPSPLFKGWDSLHSNAREIYDAACERMNLGDGGYKDCACRDCFNTAIGWGRPMCSECQDAGCEPDSECQAPGAYGDPGAPDEE